MEQLIGFDCYTFFFTLVLNVTPLNECDRKVFRINLSSRVI